MPLVSIDHITAGYDATKDVLIDVCLRISERDFLCIVGPNGGGKTTLLRVMLGLLRRRSPISVSEVVASGLMAETRCRRCSPEQRERVGATLARMGLEALAHRPIGELSGGELQRAMLGRAIVSRPRMLVLDEPNTYMDRRFGSTLGDLLAEINRDAAIVLVSHDPGALRPLIKNMAFVRRTLRYCPGNDLAAADLTDDEAEA